MQLLRKLFSDGHQAPSPLPPRVYEPELVESQEERKEVAKRLKTLEAFHHVNGVIKKHG